VIHEAQAMCLYHHPNVLPLYTAFVVGQHVWLVEPFVKVGSVYNIMRFNYPSGLDETLIAVIMKEVARALEYVHRCGGIHRDVKVIHNSHSFHFSSIIECFRLGTFSLIMMVLFC